MLARPRLHANLASRIHALSSRPVVIYRNRTLATMALQPRFSKGTDDTTASSAVEALVSSGEGAGGRWTLTKEGEALERTFKFKTFAKTWVQTTRTRPYQPRLDDQETNRTRTS